MVYETFMIKNIVWKSTGNFESVKVLYFEMENV